MLQLLGQLFQHVFALRNQRLNMGATRAILAAPPLLGCAVRIMSTYLFLIQRVANPPELQMNTVPDRNVHCIEVDGTFDDCQRLVKETFADLDYKANINYAVNRSIGRGCLDCLLWLRQSYRYSFVPTGNFGNEVRSVPRTKNGIPINKLIVATNENDILARFFATGEYVEGKNDRIASWADIQVASNFERFHIIILMKTVSTLMFGV